MVRLRSAHARRRLVEQDYLGTARDGDADLQRTLFRVGQQSGLGMAAMGHAHQLQHLLGPLARIAQCRQPVPERIAVAQRPQHRAAQVLEHRQPVKDIGDLKAAREPEAVDLERPQPADIAPVEPHRARARRKAARHQVERGRLARSVGSDHGMTFATGHRERHAADDFGLAEPLAHVGQLQRRHVCAHTLPPVSACIRSSCARTRAAAHRHATAPTAHSTAATTQGTGVPASKPIPASDMAVPLALSTCTL